MMPHKYNPRKGKNTSLPNVKTAQRFILNGRATVRDSVGETGLQVVWRLCFFKMPVSGSAEVTHLRGKKDGE